MLCSLIIGGLIAILSFVLGRFYERATYLGDPVVKDLVPAQLAMHSREQANTTMERFEHEKRVKQAEQELELFLNPELEAKHLEMTRLACIQKAREVGDHETVHLLSGRTIPLPTNPFPHTVRQQLKQWQRITK